MNRFVCALVVWLGAEFCLSPTFADQKPIATVMLQSLGGEPLANAPVTFGHAFAKGAVPAGQQLRGSIDGQQVQVDAKRHYDDGSLRFAVLSVIVPKLPVGETQPLHLLSGPAQPATVVPAVALADLLRRADFDVEVVFRFPDGKTRRASARPLLAEAGTDAQRWLQGHVATEWLLTAAPKDEQGQPDEDLRVQFQIRAYAGNAATRVSVVVENCLDHWAGNIRYDVAVNVAGKQAFAAKAVDHRRLSRWRKVFWTGEEEPAVHVAHDLAALTATGALPNYDTTLQPNALADQSDLFNFGGPRYQIMGEGSLMAFMGATGGRMEIAPYPTWAVQYLMTMSPQAKAIVLTHGDLAGSWPIHVRTAKTGGLLTIDQRPKFWLDERGQDRPEWKPDRHAAAPTQVKLDPDMAHQPSLAYVPYLVTGDFYYLEEAHFWAGYCLLSMWPEPREDDRGILAGQIRGDAWALRNMADAAWIANDDDPQGRYFDEKVRNNIAQRTAKMYGPPEHGKLGAWGVRTVADARLANAPNPNWMVTAPWEEDYLLWSMHHLVELGYADAARPRDYLLRMRVGLLTNAPDYDPMLGTPYRLVVGERTGNEVHLYEDWKKMGTENSRLGKPGMQNYGNSYSYSARAAVICGIDGGFPKAGEALEWLEANLPGHREVLAANPAWAIVPRATEK
jgi:hypothetical protein